MSENANDYYRNLILNLTGIGENGETLFETRLVTSPESVIRYQKWTWYKAIPDGLMAIAAAYFFVLSFFRHYSNYSKAFFVTVFVRRGIMCSRDLIQWLEHDRNIWLMSADSLSSLATSQIHLMIAFRYFLAIGSLELLNAEISRKELNQKWEK